MSDADPEVTELLADLTRELRRLQREVEPDRRRGPSPRGLARFTSEVAIPGLILLLQTQIRALELLRRTIRLAEGRDPRGERTGSEMRERAETLGRTTLTQLDDVLSEVQSAIDGRPENDRAQNLLSEARDLQNQIQNELDGSEAKDGRAVRGNATGIEDDSSNPDPVDIDVEAELRSLKDQTEDDDPDDGPQDGSGGSTADPDDS